MQPVLQSFATPRRNKLLVAGVAVASAGVLAITPVTIAPAIEESKKAAVGLSAFTNPLTTLQATFTNTFNNLTTLNTNATTSANALAMALSNPAVQAQFTGILTAATDPTRILSTLAGLPGYAERLAAANSSSTAQFQEAIGLLPGVLQISAGFLAEGKFLESFAEINLWFLTAGLSDLRGASLDALRVPGDILDSLGLEPLARILGTSWMDQGTNGPGFGRGLLSRAIIGNFGRAVLGAPVTAIFQTVEIMDNVRGAIQTGDLETAVSELLNAPIKIVNAFVNGYVPEFVTDPNSPIPPGPGQSFPGLIGPTGTFDFLFRQIPAEIAAALQVPRPAPAPAAARLAVDAPAESAADAPESPATLPTTDDTQLLTLEVATPEPVADVEAVTETTVAPVASTTTETPAKEQVSATSTTPSDDVADDAEPAGKPTSSTSITKTDDDDDKADKDDKADGSTASKSTPNKSTPGASTSTSGASTAGSGDSGSDSGGDSDGGDD